MPIYEYWCTDCERIWEDLTLKASDMKEKIKCPICKKEISKITSVSHFRFGKLFTPGGPTARDKDGHESLGMTGEQVETSEKDQSDLRQHVKEGKDPDEFIFRNKREE